MLYAIPPDAGRGERMERHDHPARPANPYPDRWTTLSDFEYLSALSLIRPVNTVRERLGEDGEYILQHDFEVALGIDGDRRGITVPRGLITDLTSVPRVFRIFVGRVGPWLEAAILHDYLYIAWQDVPGLAPRPSDRLFADRVMLLAMEAAAVGRATRWAIYLCLRAFGGRAFRRHETRRYAELEDQALEGSLAFTIPEEPAHADAPRRAPPPVEEGPDGAVPMS
jgi:hypothetical protein